MKRWYLVSLVLLIIVLGAYPFRWEKGPTQTIDGVKIIHKKDHWTGQRWTETYGFENGELVSGDLAPYIKQGVIEQRAKKIFQESGQKANLENKLNNAISEKNKSSKSHTEYVIKYEALTWKYEETYPEPSEPWSSQHWDWETNRRLYVIKNMPNELILQTKKWRNANSIIKSYDEKINQEMQIARTKANKQLVAEAFKKKKLAIEVWIGVAAGLSLIAVVLFITGMRKPNETAGSKVGL